MYTNISQNSELPLSQLNHKKEVVFKKRRDQHKLKEAAAKKAEAKKKVFILDKLFFTLTNASIFSKSKSLELISRD
jgi:hypothetical protein